MNQAEKLLTVARGELGTKESPANSNNVKYNTWYYGRPVTGPSTYAWCSVFVVWCFAQAGLNDLAFGDLPSARKAVAEGARNWRTLAQSKGQWVTKDYRAGDIVVFDFDANASTIEHVGIVESAKGSTATCIEGNTSVGSNSNGGEVMRRDRATTVIVGAFRPKYKEEDAELKAKILIIYSGDGDKPAADLLKRAKGIGSATMSADDYKAYPISAETIYVVGGTWKPDGATLLSGTTWKDSAAAVVAEISKK